MEENLEYGGARKSSSQWQLGNSSALSFDSESSNLFYQHQNYDLNLIQKKEVPSDRRNIPSTKLQRLSYYRTYSSSPNKTQIICMQHVEFNRFLWYYITNVFFKSLPHTYVHIFLASYTSEEHLFLTKMVPISYGCKYLFVLTAFLELVGYIDTAVLLLDYVINGIVYKNPWNRQQRKNESTECLHRDAISAVFSTTGAKPWIKASYHINTSQYSLDMPCRCKLDSYFYPLRNATVNCYTLGDFAEKIKNGTAHFKIFAYVSGNETFQVSQIQYYRLPQVRVEDCRAKSARVAPLWIRLTDHVMSCCVAFFGIIGLLTIIFLIVLYNKVLCTNRRLIWHSQQSTLYFIVIWLLAALVHKQVYKNTFWKTLHTVQWIAILVDLTSFTYLIVSYFNEQFGIAMDFPPVVDDLAELLWKADIDMLAESTTAPPVVHILTSRSVQEIEPSRDSTIMITSNALYFIFRGLLTYRLKKHIENLVQAPILLTDLNQHSWFYFWPMYFSTFYLGDIYTIVFLTLNLIMELFAITVTYYCLVEVVLCEWKWIKRWMITTILFVIAVLLYLVTSYNRRMIMCIYSKVIATLTEVLLLYGLYPLGRLVDDITFHYGVPPTRLRILSLRLVPIFYTVKCYTMMEALIMVMIKSSFTAQVPHYYWMWAFMLIPIPLGVLYTAYQYIIKQKKSWQSMFRPVDHWGPKDYASRQLRKQYDSRVYVGSQAPRVLGRYLIGKSEPKAYRLDVRYDTSKTTTVVNAANAQFENEKKFV